MPDFNTNAENPPLKDNWPFDAWLNLAVTRFGLPPREFWAMSVKDWLTLTAPTNPQGLSRDGFAALSARYPDETERKNNDPNG